MSTGLCQDGPVIPLAPGISYVADITDITTRNPLFEIEKCVIFKPNRGKLHRSRLNESHV